jgi:hypothetical protein
MIRIEVKRNGYWIVSSTFSANYPLASILDAAAQLAAIIQDPIRVTRALNAMGPATEVIEAVTK